MMVTLVSLASAHFENIKHFSQNQNTCALDLSFCGISICGTNSNTDQLNFDIVCAEEILQ
jgi:hypothetical protein